MEIRNVDGNNDIKILRISRFTDESVNVWNSNWDKKIKEIVASKAKGLIIDLRGNPGGFFDSALHAGEDFLPKGTIMAKQQNRNGKEDVFRVDRTGKLLDIPIVVLVDEGSASASEILSGMLQQNKRAKVVGVNTYGKGTAQTIVSYSDGSSLHLTILKWLLPNGEWLNRENPIKPDVVQEYPDAEFIKGNDVQLNKALELLK
jgi:carboxyl-terminal processing protease